MKEALIEMTTRLRYLDTTWLPKEKLLHMNCITARVTILPLVQ